MTLKDMEIVAAIGAALIFLRLILRRRDKYGNWEE